MTPDAPTPPPFTPPAEFLAAAADLGVEFEPGDVERLGRYLALLLDANTRFNLTAVRDPQEAWTRHILDALTLVPLLAELPPASRVIDVGSGGGIPGIPLAITLPTLQFTLLESTGKKARFLESAVHTLALANTRVIADRAETIAHDRGDATSIAGERTYLGGHREAYDAVLARALGPLPVIAELCVPLCKVGGRVLLIKGQKADEELAEARQALHLLHAVHAGTVDTPTGRIVVLDKNTRTPRDYPRRSGEPKRAPLGATPTTRRTPHDR